MSRRLYCKGTTITAPDGRRRELVAPRVRRGTQAPPCARCGSRAGWQWRPLTAGGYLARAYAALCDAPGCRPTGTATQPDGFTEAAQR